MNAPAKVTHTPGPWVAGGMEGTAIVDSSRSLRIAHVVHNNPDYSANARLIAAAPDLLAACLMAEASIAQDFEARKVPEDQRMTLYQVRAAIAKAEER